MGGSESCKNHKSFELDKDVPDDKELEVRPPNNKSRPPGVRETACPKRAGGNFTRTIS